MNKIKFSHHYLKLQNRTRHGRATLIAVIPYKIDGNTPREFLSYDTTYIKRKVGDKYETDNYELKKGDYVLLLFHGLAGIFTTIRPRKGRYGDKFDYYSKLVNQEFEIVIEEE